MNRNLAISQQQVAARRHEWAVIDFNCYRDHQTANRPGEMEDCKGTFIIWAEERAEYAARARKEMGITDDDQYYA